MSVQQSGVARPEGEPDSFPDPKRSWGRSGSLMATWVVLLLSVYFAGWVFDGVVDKTAESNLEKPVESSKQTARRVLHFSFVEREPSKADALMCEGSSGVGPSDLTDKLTGWEAANGRANTALTFEEDDGQSVNGGLKYHMRVDVEYGTNFEKWYYDVTVNDTDGFCVSAVEDVTPA